MKIKGFDKNLCCRGFQFEIGKTYDTGAQDDELALCTNTVFHYCDSLQQVHEYYSCKAEGNRFCEIKILGKEVTDGQKCGSNRIKIVREIVGDELNTLMGLVNKNTGLFNTGSWNTGDWNTGSGNAGGCNTGCFNAGDFNAGSCNAGDRNTGGRNAGNRDTGDGNTGSGNTGDCNTGSGNTGDCNTGGWNTGDRNTGNCNTGDRNTGNCNTGEFNSCSNSSGFFCTQEPKAFIFNMPTDMTVSEFRNSKYGKALYSSPFILTKWVNYTKEEMENDKDKELMGGYLHEYTYKEACAEWWNNMSEDNRKIIMSIPNFNKEIFKEITGIEV